MNDYLKETLERLENEIYKLIPSFKSENGLIDGFQRTINAPLTPEIRETTAISQDTIPRCPKNCKCCCHSKSFSQRSSWHYVFGSLFIATTRNPLDASMSSCGACCVQKSQPLISLLYYFPPWLGLRHVGLTYFDGDATISFPRIVAPDSKIAVSIREGNYIGVRELLEHGEASPLDIIGPYRFSIYHLPLATDT
jgi:hypothetical protein